MKSQFTLSLLVLVMCACSAIQTRSKDEAAIGQIKKVAIVAFSATEPASSKVGFDLGSGKLDGKSGGSMIPQYDDAVDSMYDELGKTMRSSQKWNVMDKKTMATHKGYVDAFNKTMKGFHNKMPPGDGMNQFIVKDIMDYDSPRILDVAGRDALITALGVDAIIVARIDVNTTGTTVMGIGSRHPQSTLSFSIYRKGDVKPVWFEGSLKGEEAKESVGKTAFIDEALLQKLALKSAQTAFTKIGSTETR
jgi:hypothetical protein